MVVKQNDKLSAIDINFLAILPLAHIATLV